MQDNRKCTHSQSFIESVRAVQAVAADGDVAASLAGREVRVWCVSSGQLTAIASSSLAFGE